jgi:archaellum component FlaC
MSVKDKVIFVIIVLLMAGGGYVQWNYTQVMDRMDGMDKKQFTHVDEVNAEFREDLKRLDLQFIGRGKHLQKAQKDIIANENRIIAITDSLARLVEDLSYELNEFVHDTDKEFATLNNNLGDLEDNVDGERRRNARRFSDIEQTVTSVQNSLRELESLNIIIKAKEKQD